ELDLIHEEQLESGKLKDYQILVLFDVKLLPAKAAKQIADFVQNGGTVIADCVPVLDENRLATDSMEKLFGVRNTQTGRILWPAEVKQMLPPKPGIKKPRNPLKTPSTKAATQPAT